MLWHTTNLGAKLNDSHVAYKINFLYSMHVSSVTIQIHSALSSVQPIISNAYTPPYLGERLFRVVSHVLPLPIFPSNVLLSKSVDCLLPILLSQDIFITLFTCRGEPIILLRNCHILVPTALASLPCNRVDSI